MIKVVEVIPTLSMGGAESMVRDYCLLIDRDRFDVSVVVLTEHKNTPIERVLEERGINVVYIGELLFKTDDLLSVQRAIRRLSRYIYFRQVIMNMKPDVIHLHLQIGGYMRMLPLKRMRCNLFLTVHNVVERYFDKSRSNRIKYREYKEVSRLIHKYNLELITLHDDLRDELRRFFSTDRVITINNGIRMDAFNSELYDKTESKRRLGFDAGDIVIGHVGSMHPQKNHELIIKIFEDYSKKNERVRLLLVGDGELKPDVLCEIDNRGLNDKTVILSNRSDVPNLMSAMDVLVFPSRWEGFGNVVIEAQCMNLPCVVSDAVPDVVRITDKVHVLSLDDSIDKWVGEIEAALSDKKGLLPVSDKNDYDMINCVRKLERIYGER